MVALQSSNFQLPLLVSCTTLCIALHTEWIGAVFPKSWLLQLKYHPLRTLIGSSPNNGGSVWGLCIVFLCASVKFILHPFPKVPKFTKTVKNSHISYTTYKKCGAATDRTPSLWNKNKVEAEFATNTQPRVSGVLISKLRYLNSHRGVSESWLCLLCDDISLLTFAYWPYLRASSAPIETTLLYPT